MESKCTDVANLWDEHVWGRCAHPYEQQTLEQAALQHSHPAACPGNLQTVNNGQLYKFA